MQVIEALCLSTAAHICIQYAALHHTSYPQSAITPPPTVSRRGLPQPFQTSIR